MKTGVADGDRKMICRGRFRDVPRTPDGAARPNRIQKTTTIVGNKVHSKN